MSIPGLRLEFRGDFAVVVVVAGLRLVVRGDFVASEEGLTLRVLIVVF